MAADIISTPFDVRTDATAADIAAPLITSGDTPFSISLPNIGICVRMV